MCCVLCVIFRVVSFYGLNNILQYLTTILSILSQHPCRICRVARDIVRIKALRFLIECRTEATKSGLVVFVICFHCLSFAITKKISYKKSSKVPWVIAGFFSQGRPTHRSYSKGVGLAVGHLRPSAVSNFPLNDRIALEREGTLLCTFPSMPGLRHFVRYWRDAGIAPGC